MRRHYARSLEYRECLRLGEHGYRIAAAAWGTDPLMHPDWPELTIDLTDLLALNWQRSQRAQPDIIAYASGIEKHFLSLESTEPRASDPS
ncbi:MAG: hypothetical protein H0W08_22750 [Acidobacteria bacterium]|nr:hypothetical protein [Acidobacteriota bacterium]